MATNEKSGFFDATETGGSYDKVYYAQDFANYFKLFIGNGVFVNPTNQLKVVAGTGLKAIVKEGWAFINGYWYHNENDMELDISLNPSGNARTDSIVVQLDETAGVAKVVKKEGQTSITQGSPIHELKLAEITVAVAASSITDANIRDTRSDESVCGFVKSTVENLATEDLFNQFQSAFEQWFESIKNKLDGDTAGNLQNQIDGIIDGTTTVDHAAEADKVNWSGVEGKPGTFPPDPHTHSFDSITGKPSTYPSSWGQVSGKPSSFTPSSHTHSYDSITGKPSLQSKIKYGTGDPSGGVDGDVYIKY